MAAKDKHRTNIIKYLADWDNVWPSRTEMAALIGVRKETLWRIFTAAELDEVEAEALELRKKNAARPRQEAYKALIAQFDKGNVPAIKEFLERTEGKVVDKTESDLNVNVLGGFSADDQALLRTLALKKAQDELKKLG